LQTAYSLVCKVCSHTISCIVHSNMVVFVSIYISDPICFHQHLCKSLFNFHFARTDDNLQSGKEWPSPISIEGLMNLAGTEVRLENMRCEEIFHFLLTL